MDIMKSDNLVSKLFKSILGVFREEKKPIITQPVLRKKQEIFQKPKHMNKNVQMPAPWSKVEKVKRVKRDYFY